MIGYKAFKPGMVCRGKQYKESTTFTEPEADMCRCGMHFCKNPFKLFMFYNLVEDGEMPEIARVSAPDDKAFADEAVDKYVTTELHIGRKLSWEEFVIECIEYGNTNEDVNGAVQKSSATDGGVLSSFADFSTLLSIGIDKSIIATGVKPKVLSIGPYSNIFTKQQMAQIASLGGASDIASMGAHSEVVSMGNDSTVFSGGHSTKITVKGESSRALANGRYSQVNVEGENCIAVNLGVDSQAKGKLGTWIVLAEYEYDYNNGFKTKCVKAEMVDGEKIKEDTYYCLKDGEFVECSECKIQKFDF